MKLLHTADWHIGRTLNGFSLLEEQKYMFKQILDIAIDEKVDGIVIAGDLYDRTIPNTAAVTALSNMFNALNIEHHFPIYAISGNHDGAKRLNYSRSWMQSTGFELNTLLEEAFTPIETPTAQLFLLPFFDPMDARVYYQQQGMAEEKVKQIKTIGAAMKLVIQDLVAAFDPSKQHLLITHFAVTAKKEDVLEKTSETASTVGGLETLTADEFSDFDYVFLGHIHTRFASPTQKIQYSGSPTKFNVKEARSKNQGKGVNIVTVDETGVQTDFRPLHPGTDLIVLEADWATLTASAFYEQQPTHKAWFAVTIQDFDRSQHEHTNIRAQLQAIYGTIVELDYQNKPAKKASLTTQRNLEHLSNEAVVAQFYQAITDTPLSATQKAFVDNIFIDLRKEV